MKRLLSVLFVVAILCGVSYSDTITPTSQDVIVLGQPIAVTGTVNATIGSLVDVNLFTIGGELIPGNFVQPNGFPMITKGVLAMGRDALNNAHFIKVDSDGQQVMLDTIYDPVNDMFHVALSGSDSQQIVEVVGSEAGVLRSFGIVTDATVPFDPGLPTPNAQQTLPLAFDTIGGFLSFLNSTGGNLNVSDGGSSLTVDGTVNIGTVTTDYSGTDGSPGPAGAASIAGTDLAGNLQELLTSTSGASVIAARDNSGAIVERFAGSEGGTFPTGMLTFALNDNGAIISPKGSTFGIRVDGIAPGGTEAIADAEAVNGTNVDVTMPTGCTVAHSCRVCNVDTSGTATVKWNSTTGDGMTIFPGATVALTSIAPNCIDSPKGLNVPITDIYVTGTNVDIEKECVCD